MARVECAGMPNQAFQRTPRTAASLNSSFWRAVSNEDVALSAFPFLVSPVTHAPFYGRSPPAQLLPRPLHGRIGLGRESKSMRLLSIRMGRPVAEEEIGVFLPRLQQQGRVPPRTDHGLHECHGWNRQSMALLHSTTLALAIQLHRSLAARGDNRARCVPPRHRNAPAQLSVGKPHCVCFAPPGHVDEV